MAYSNGIISQPVSIYDVQKCFGLAACDLATLIVNANINIWSGIKPMYSTKVTPLTSTDRGTPRVLSGYKTGGGIKKRSYLYSDYISGMDSHGNPTAQIWALDRPVVDGSCAFRLTDFAGYWHNAVNMFTIFSYINNLTNIPIPSADGQSGVNIDFLVYTNVISGCIILTELFGDCLDFYPAVVMTCGSGSYQYAKTTTQTVRQLIDANGNISGTITINTADFAAAVAADWRSSHSGDPYASYPLRSNDEWTSCVVLSSRQLTGGSGSNHTFNSSDTIIRLEYTANVDRWTLPLKQSKYTVINSAWMKITLSKQTNQNGHLYYKLASIYIYVNKTATSGGIQFAVTGSLQCQIGIVSIPNGGSATHPNHLNANFGNINYTASSGQQSVIVSPNAYYEITGITAGNQLCNGTITISDNNIGTFSGGFSVDVSAGNSTYEISNIPLL